MTVAAISIIVSGLGLCLISLYMLHTNETVPTHPPPALFLPESSGDFSEAPSFGLTAPPNEVAAVDESLLDDAPQAVEAQIDKESNAFYATGQVWDDGIIDPRDTRTVLGIALSAVHSNLIEGTSRFGVFRM